MDGEFYGVVETSKFEGTVQTAMGLLRTSLAVAIIFTFVLVAYGGNLIVSKLISPLERIIEKTDKITSENLTERVELSEDNYPEEVVKLVNSINKLLERLERAFKQISQFTSDVAHELLTPLTVIKDEIEITLMKKRRSNEYIRTLNLIQKQTERTISIIKSMLYLAKADAGIIKANLERVNVSNLIQELISTFNLKARQKNIKLRFYCDGDVVVHTDEKLLFEALRNIIDNAIEYTNSGGKVEISCERANGGVKIFVSDTGIGISEDDLQHIFNRFYRGKNAFEINASGTGLGLSLTKSIIEILSGKIEVSSQLGKGTKFVIYLPEKL
ncbi:heavy metal sensor kinase [Candidatus Kryptonium thompsonii]|nr:heavy metal sensor kinase [Candidatus Kryptonium thompsoni]